MSVANDIASQPGARHPNPGVRPTLALAMGYQFRKPGAGFAISPEAFLHVSSGGALASLVSFGGVRIVASWFHKRDSADR